MTWLTRLKQSLFSASSSSLVPTPSQRSRLHLETLEDRIQPSITVTLDYTYDVNGFFNSQARRDVLQNAVDSIASHLNDNLTAIIPTGGDTWFPQIFDPATGNSRVLPQLNVNQNELRIYVGGRAMSGSEAGEGGGGGAFRIAGSNAWINTVLNRGQGITQGSGARDYGPWGGSIAFDTLTNWYFGTDPASIASSQLSFYSVAQHEFAHVLGFGTSDSYQNKIVGTSFTGRNSVSSYGSAVPLSSGFDLEHWNQAVTSGGAQTVLTPVLTQGKFNSFTSLDFAGLADIGWNVSFGGGGGGGGAVGGTGGGAVGGGGVTAPPPANFGGVRGQHIFATSTEPGNAPHVQVFNLDGTLRFSFFAYAQNVTTGIRIATGDVTGDGFDDIITGAGPGGGPHVKVFDGQTGAEIRSFYAYAPSFNDGIFVAVGDVNGDGHADIITGAGPGGGPHVQVFDGVTGAVIRSFYAYAPDYVGGVVVAAGDVNGDGIADIITGTGKGYAAHVRVFDGSTLGILQSFYAYVPSFLGGVTVSTGDINGDGIADIITAAGPGGGPHVQAFDGRNLNVLQSFYASTSATQNGIRVTAKDVNGDGKDDFITGIGAGAAPLLTIYSGSDLGVLNQFYPYATNYTGGFYIG